LNQFIKEHITGSSVTMAGLVDKTPIIDQMAVALRDCIRDGGTIFSCGNGGSAAQAIHFTEELVARYKKDRPPIRAQHFCDASTITCWANDYSFEDVFARQAEAYLTSRDILLVLSTSGNSPNILKALTQAKKAGARSLALLGKDGGLALGTSSLALVVESSHTAHIQEAHLVIIHILCEMLENFLFP